MVVNGRCSLVSDASGSWVQVPDLPRICYAVLLEVRLAPLRRFLLSLNGLAFLASVGLFLVCLFLFGFVPVRLVLVALVVPVGCRFRVPLSPGLHSCLDRQCSLGGISFLVGARWFLRLSGCVPFCVPFCALLSQWASWCLLFCGCDGPSVIAVDGQSVCRCCCLCFGALSVRSRRFACCSVICCLCMRTLLRPRVSPWLAQWVPLHVHGLGQGTNWSVLGGVGACAVLLAVCGWQSPSFHACKRWGPRRPGWRGKSSRCCMASYCRLLGRLAARAHGRSLHEGPEDMCCRAVFVTVFCNCRVGTTARVRRSRYGC